MGFSFRRSFGGNGLLRINVSKSGIGLSVGGPGFRIGSNSRGLYTHITVAPGIYYRGSSGKKRRQTTAQRTAAQRRQRQSALQDKRDKGIIPETELGPKRVTLRADTTAMESLHAKGLTTLLNQNAGGLISFGLIIGCLVALAMAALAPWHPTPGLGIIAIAGGSGLLAWFTIDVPLRTTKIEYTFRDGWSRNRFKALRITSEHLRQSHHLIMEHQRRSVTNSKHNRGLRATSLGSKTRYRRSRPPLVRLNLRVPTLRGQRIALCFMPDFLLVARRRFLTWQYGAIDYGRLTLQSSPHRVVAPHPTPRDADPGPYTFQHVNRDGGPDRRYTNNRRFETYMFELVSLKSAGFQTNLIFSNNLTAHLFTTGFQKIVSRSREAHR